MGLETEQREKNATTRDFLDILAARATTTPDADAHQLVGDDGSIRLTYAGFARRVGQLGSALHAAEMGAGRVVAVCMENRPAWPVAYLATWYADGIIVPIDPALEAAAIRRIFEHSGAVACLTSNAMVAKINIAAQGLVSPPTVLNVDAGGHRAWDGEPHGGGVPLATDAPVGGSWDNLVGQHATSDEIWSPQRPQAEIGTIMYTSGTTGVPKGVMLSRQALLSNIDAGLQRIGLRAEDNVLGVLPLFHALPLMANCLGPLFCGARVTYLAELNPDKIIAAFRRHGITAFACVPLFFYRFHDRVMKRLAALPPARRRVARVLLRVNRLTRRHLGLNLGRRFFAAAHEPFGEQLRLFVTGGAKFNRDTYEDFLDLGFPLIQGYGLTEASAVLSAHGLGALRGDTVGSPVPGVEVRIEAPNEDGVGEILALSPSRMIGYYRNQEATDEVFDGDWLRTGDLGRFEPDGQLQVTGRAKDMIVLASGKNIYPDELEAYYSQAEVVAEICILGVDDPARQGSERLHAVVVPDFEVLRQRGQVNVREMVKWELEGLGLDLPSPQRVTSLELRSEPLPRTTTRKIKRFELLREVVERGPAAPATVSAPAAARAREQAVDEPPWAHQVRQIIARNASVEGVSRPQHLDLDLGLESLDRIEMQAEIEDVFCIDLPAEAAGEVQTVGDLLDLIAQHVNDASAAMGTVSDRWESVLADTPPTIDDYLTRRPLVEWGVRAILAMVRLGLRLAGLRIAGAENLPQDYPFIIAPNHLSYVDGFLLAAALPHRVRRRIFFVGYSDYFEGTIMGFVSRLLRTIPIDQNRHLEQAMQAAAEGLRRDMVLVIFPEGARSADGEVKEFRRGTGILARILDVPVVPVGLWGTYQMWPREGRLRPHATAVRFGQSVRVEESSARAAEEAFMVLLRDAVIDLAASAKALYQKKK